MNGVNIPGVQVLHDDCMDVLAGLPDGAFDLALIDPPYGENVINSSGLIRGYNGRGKEWDKQTPGAEFFAELFRVSRHQVVFGAQYFMPHLPISRGFAIWDKQQPENFSMASAEVAWVSLDQVTRTFRQRPQWDIDRIHPTQKPIRLYRWLLAQYAQPGWRILDTHMGSGSSVIACVQDGFDVLAIERDQQHFYDACHRINNATAQCGLFNPVSVSEQAAKQEVMFHD